MCIAKKNSPYFMLIDHAIRNLFQKSKNTAQIGTDRNPICQSVVDYQGYFETYIKTPMNNGNKL